MERHRALSCVLPTCRVENTLEEETRMACLSNLQITQTSEEKMASESPLTIRELGWTRVEQEGGPMLLLTTRSLAGEQPGYAWFQ